MDSKRFLTGTVVGAIVLFVAGYVILYGAQNVSTLTATLVDPVASAVHGAIGGAAIGLVVSRMKSGA
jgi:hypothetical protein